MHGRNAERGAKAVGRSKMPAAQHDSSLPTSPPPTTSVGSPLRPERWTSWSTTPAYTVRCDRRHRRRRLRRPFRHQPAGAVHPGAEAGARHGRARTRHRGQHQHRRGHDAVCGSGHLRRQQGRAGPADQALGRRVRRGGGARQCHRTGTDARPRAPRTSPTIVEGLGRTRALERVGEPDEIARAVAFVASPAASYINGVVLPVDGGAQALRPAA